MNKEERTHNITSLIDRMTCFYDAFVFKESEGLRINIIDKNPAHHKSANRYRQTRTIARPQTKDIK